MKKQEFVSPKKFGEFRPSVPWFTNVLKIILLYYTYM